MSIVTERKFNSAGGKGYSLSFPAWDFCSEKCGFGPASGGAAHGEDVSEGCEEDDGDTDGDESRIEREVAGAKGLQDGVLEDGEQAGGFGLNAGDELEGQGLKAVPVLRGNTHGVVEAFGLAVHEADQQEDDSGDGGQDEEAVAWRAPGVGIAGAVEVRGDAVRKSI